MWVIYRVGAGYPMGSFRSEAESCKYALDFLVRSGIQCGVRFEQENRDGKD